MGYRKEAFKRHNNALSIVIMRKSSFSLQLKSICSEIELSLRWKTPMIIVAIYSTSHVLSDAEKFLSKELFKQGQNLVPMLLSEDNPNLVEILNDSDILNSVFSVRCFENSESEDNANTYRYLNFHREFFVDENVRLLLWLRSKEFQKMALFAPDFFFFGGFLFLTPEHIPNIQDWCGSRPLTV